MRSEASVLPMAVSSASINEGMNEWYDWRAEQHGARCQDLRGGNLQALILLMGDFTVQQDPVLEAQFNRQE